MVPVVVQPLVALCTDSSWDSFKKDLKCRREIRGSWHANGRKKKFLLLSFIMLEQIQLWCAKHSSGLGPTVCTGRICSADSLRFRWSRQPRQSQFYTDEQLHIILGVGNRMCRPLAVLSIKGGTAFLERHLRNKLIIHGSFLLLWLLHFPFVLATTVISARELLSTIPVQVVFIGIWWTPGRSF